MLKKVVVVAAAMLAALVLTPIAAADPGTEEQAPCWMLYWPWEWPAKGCLSELTGDAETGIVCVLGGVYVDWSTIPPDVEHQSTAYFYDCTVAIIA